MQAKIVSRFAASPWGAFLAELPFKAASAACCRYSATDEGRSLFLDFPNIFDKKFLKIKRCNLFSILKNSQKIV